MHGEVLRGGQTYPGVKWVSCGGQMREGPKVTRGEMRGEVLDGEILRVSRFLRPSSAFLRPMKLK